MIFTPEPSSPEVLASSCLRQKQLFELVKAHRPTYTGVVVIQAELQTAFFRAMEAPAAVPSSAPSHPLTCRKRLLTKNRDEFTNLVEITFQSAATPFRKTTGDFRTYLLGGQVRPCKDPREREGERERERERERRAICIEMEKGGGERRERVTGSLPPRGVLK